MPAASSRTRAARPSSPSSSPRERQALIIFAKAPEPGEVKTRLSPPLTSKQAACLHEAFLLDVVRASFFSVGVTRWLSCAPSTTHPFFRGLARRARLRLLTQTGATLGERMASALRQALDAGATRAVLIGTDLPTLPPSILHDAFRLLRDADVVLGPACDGGYYLIGVSRRVPPIFDGIPWGRSTVLEATLAVINRLGLRCRLLPFWYDVDTLPSLRLLAAHLASLRREAGTASRRLPAATARWCAAWMKAQNTKAPGRARGLRHVHRRRR